MRFLLAGGDALLVQLDDLDQVLALFASLNADLPNGVAELVPAAETLAVTYNPNVVTAGQLAAEINQRDLTAQAQTDGREVEIPVNYDGEDLEEVASLTGLSRAEVIARHGNMAWLAAFNGFAPGFCYLAGGDPALNVPRRSSPRTAVPAGSVALAGNFSAVYPQDSPGGWQLIGTTPLPMWDINRDPPAWLKPGDRVRFVDLAQKEVSFSLPPSSPVQKPEKPDARLEIIAAPFPVLFQDQGRIGQLAQGIAASGAVDAGALRALNRLLGNPSGTPALELVGGGLRLRATTCCTIALTGAPRSVTLNGNISLPSHTVLAMDAGDEVVIGAADSGMYGYLGVRGGFRVAHVLDSAATDTLARIGPDVLTAGDWVGIAQTRAEAVAPPLPLPALPRSDEVLMVDVIMGPRTDWFEATEIDSFLNQNWTVTQQSSRIGKRLEGVPLRRPDRRELPSEATMTGAIQIPHSGQPVLFLPDHPLTGGYPVIATVAPHHLDLVAQAPPGAKLRFRAIAPFAEITPQKGQS